MLNHSGSGHSGSLSKEMEGQVFATLCQPMLSGHIFSISNLQPSVKDRKAYLLRQHPMDMGSNTIQV